MANYAWEGPGQMKELGLDRAEPPKITQPSTARAPVAEKSKIYVCKAPQCGRKFKKAMIVARHFNASHDNLRETKDSWREYVEEVWGD